MAKSLQSLLTLPVTSDAFTSLPPSVVDSPSDNGSPPRKTQRLSSDTGSSARHPGRTDPSVRKSPIRIRIIGEPVLTSKENLDVISTKLRQCIQILLTKDAPYSIPLPLSYEKIYSACQSVVCVWKSGEGLYSTLTLEVEKCVNALVKELVDAKERSEALWYVKEFVSVCQWFETQVTLLRSLMTYLDQIYVVKNPGILSVLDLCFERFGNIFLNPMISTRITNSIHEWAMTERRIGREPENRNIIPVLIKHLHTHGQYQQIFEDPYLVYAREYYTAESANLAGQLRDNGPEFQNQVSLRVQQEVKRSKELLPVGSWGIVRKVTLEALLGGHLDWLAKAALPTLMDNRDVLEMAKLYRLFEQVQGTKVLCSVFKMYIEVSVREIVIDPVLDEDMIECLLQFKSFIDSVISLAFSDPDPSIRDNTNDASASTSAPLPSKPNQDFAYARSDAFTSGFATRPNKPAELLAKHLDHALRKGQRGLSEMQFAQELDDALGLYKFTKDKDVFRAFYTKCLAKRLLLEKSASDDFEKAMLKKLKEQFDPEFGMSEQMFTDLALSRDKMREYYEKSNHPSQRLNVMVLQRSVWPFAVRQKGIDLPAVMQDELNRYLVFYRTKHKGHKLYWDHALGTAVLKAQFNAGAKDLLVSLYQAVILLLFNDTNELRYGDILEQTNMVTMSEDGSERSVSDEDELKRTLQSLACGKKKVLKKIPPGRDVDKKDVFRFNPDFTDPRAKVHINSIQAKETVEESKRTQVSVEGDRRHFLDAAIVRIMKARKELSNEELKAATIEAVKNHFVPEVKHIKERIESLVEQEYLKRAEEDPNLFIYVA